MVNNNKILTVSYGTFSCTLEGFDDSFGTMKAIAEYFRDLAADDRYFGAEPPSPDAEMLARIAEREIARRVEAHREDNTFVLRADPAAAIPAAAEDEDAKAAQAEEKARAEAEAKARAEEEAAKAAAKAAREEAEAARVKEAEEKAAAEKAEAEAKAEAKAAKEKAARKAARKAAKKAAKAAAAAKAAEADAAAEKAQEETAANAAPESPADGNESLDIAGLSALVAESQASAEAEDALEAETEAQTKTPEASKAPQEAPEPDSVAAKLQRIRDVVSQKDAENTQDTDYSEDEHANDILTDEDAATEEFLADAQSDIAAAFEADYEAEQDKLAADESADEEDDIEAMLAKLSETDAAGETDPANDAPLIEAPVGSEDSDTQEAEEAEDDAPLRARVVKMKKADFDAAIADGVLEEDEDDAPEGSLSREDEDDLMRELAAVEAEIAAGAELSAENDHEDEMGEDTANLFSDDDLEEALDHDDAIAAALRSERSARLTRADTDGEMGRILSETNTKLDEDEGRGRRSAIAHLRAAVKATKAERDLGGDLGASGRDTEVYRDDLETAVRPRRPTAGRTERPRRAAPLKLVAEQRIDTPKDNTPVQPRRIRAAKPAPMASDGGGFADYVENVGAHNLSEVLEAAAAYMSFVEGQGEFSRPQLMSKLSETDHADTTREDRLRSFGQLLRAGKIRKLGGGRFEVAEEISYRPAS